MGTNETVKTINLIRLIKKKLFFKPKPKSKPKYSLTYILLIKINLFY